MARREHLEVIHDILRTIRDRKNAIRPTPLMRYANLSTKSFDEYKQELLEKEMIRELEQKKHTVITLTDKGFRFLDRYEVIKNFIDEFEL